jgi:hypothetical protein
MQPSNGLALASLLGTIQGLYPQARVTSTYRGPNNPLTRRNPSSLHAQGSPEDPRAVDIAPIPGVTFDQYRAAVGAKVPLAQAFDEASHPFPWTTGPNWHLAQGQAPKMAARPKPRTLADIAAPSMSAMPVGLASAPVASPMTLADLALPQGDIPQKKASKFTAGNILGVLGSSTRTRCFRGRCRARAEQHGQALQNQERSATLPYAAPKAAAEATNAQTQAQVNAATAPAEIVSKRGNAQKSAAEGQAAQTNLQVSGGADNSQAKNAASTTARFSRTRLYEGTGIKDDP